jgi:ankyrin repeat protein
METYDELFTLIRAQPGPAPVTAERAIKWVMCSSEPLKSEELVAAISQDPESDDVYAVDSDIDFVLQACRNLLVVDANTNTCHFAHQSLSEYVEWRIWTSSQAHAHVAKTCLALLIAEERRITSGHAAGPLAIDDFRKGLGPLLTYATRNWPYHVQKHGEDNIDPRLAVLLKAFLGSIDSSSRAFQHWYGLRLNERPSLRDSDCTYVEVAPPSLATFAIRRFGFHAVLGDWWETGPSDPHRRNDEGNTLLHLAVISGSDTLTLKLLNLGLDVNASGSPRVGFPLTAAASEGNERLCRLLLDAGADVNQRGGRHGSPLGAAARNGRREIVQLLLDAGGDADIGGGEYNSPLAAAASGGYNEVVRLLLNCGASLNRQGGRHGSALGAAARRGHLETMQLLVNEGADVNGHGGGHGVPLSAAAYGGYVLAVQHLLDSGADVNWQGGVYGSPLGAAARQGHIKTVQLLIAAGADVNIRGGEDGSPLGAAAREGHVGIVDLLLSAGAAVNPPDTENGGPLTAAARQGNLTIMQQLIAAGADVDVPGGEHGCALGAAAHGGHEQVVRLLLDAGADVSLSRGAYGCPLLAAAHGGHQHIVQLLLDHGADRETALPESATDMADVSSVASVPGLTSGSSYSSTGAPNVSNLVNDFAESLCLNEALQAVFSLVKKHMKMDRFERNFARILAAYAKDLRNEAQRKSEVHAARLMRAGAKSVASRVRTRIDPGKDDLRSGWTCLPTRPPLSKDDRVKDFVNAQSDGTRDMLPVERPPDEDHSDDEEGCPDISDYDGNDSDNEDGKPSPVKNADIAKVRDFLFESLAFQQLIRKATTFTSPLENPRRDDKEGESSHESASWVD